MQRSLLAVRGIDGISVEDWRVLTECAQSLGIEPDWLATIISFETGGSFSPAQPNMWALKNAQKKNVPYQGAMGLLQFMPDTAERMGTSTDALREMTFSEQMVFVYRYLETYAHRIDSLEDCYLAVFYPAALGQPDSFPVGQADGSRWQRAVYEQNKGLDVNHDGTIRKREITATIRAVRDAANGERVAWSTEEDEDTRVANLFDLVRIARENDDGSRKS
jgi:hypothetical protein